MHESSTASSPPWPRRVIAAVLNPAHARRTTGPVLDPARWGRGHTRLIILGLLVATAAGVVEAVRHASDQVGGSETVRAVLAAALGMGLIGLALTLRGTTVPGFLVGLLYVTAGMLSWTYTGATTWALLGVEGLLFAIWTFPWVRDLVGLPRLGTAWLGLAYWFLGVIGAGLVLRPGLAMERVAYAGLFTLGALAIVTATRRSGQDLSIGVASAFLVALAALFLVGSGNALDNVHTVPANAWGRHMEHRFWGGPGLLYHPNSIAVAAVIVAIRIGADGTFERWQRYAALGMVTVILLLVNSRTGLLYLAAAAVVHALLIWYGRRGSASPDEYGRRSFPTARAAWGAALLPIVLAVLIAVGSGGTGFLGAQRYNDGTDDVTSGRRATWVQVWKDFTTDNTAQKIFGDTSNARATVHRPSSGGAPPVGGLTTDNAAVGALRRGGILGVIAFLFGLGLMLWHAIRGVRLPGRGRYRPSAWFTMAAVGSVPTIVSADWLLGGTGGTLWIYLLAGEAYLLHSAARQRRRDAGATVSGRPVAVSPSLAPD
ncbi:hypothetical protein [Rugosimonospora africana]|uniref:O-antigen ligase n=1 Tax=Rugosimonospora africana TaxID=556532 RepID=A0A8J3R521_9ACTN|nr:hypothetical protein [Rugosimonospora africana]GIH21617.1 hypothetical protein Raf01_97890 [Rugosimonospora africana]